MKVTTERVIAVATVVAAIAAGIQTWVVVRSLNFIKDQVNLQTSQLQLQTSQLKMQENLTRAANAQAMVGLSLPLNLQAMEHPDVAKLWIKGRKGETLNEVESEQYANLVATYLTFHENIYIQHEKGLLDPDIYSAWDADLEKFIERQHPESYWKRNSGLYHQKFGGHVDALIAKQPPAPTPTP